MNIALIGMMGSGKTTVGKLLLNELKGFSFIDTDEETVKQENCSINEIFADKGEEYFRKIESDILDEILNSDNQIISTGGGIIKSDKNIDLLRKKSFVVYLKANSDTLYKHVKNNDERPLLKNEDIKTKIENLLNEREILYNRAAHYTVITDDKNPNEIAMEIKEIYATGSKN